MKKSYKKVMDLKSDNPVWLPVVMPYIEFKTPDNCKHEGDFERKRGGYVCLECSAFLNYARTRVDKQINKSYADTY